MSDIFFETLHKITPERKAQIHKNLEITERIYNLLAHKKWTQKDLANTLNTTEEEVESWLSGLHNFNISTIIQLELIFKQNIISVEKQIV